MLELERCAADGLLSCSGAAPVVCESALDDDEEAGWAECGRCVAVADAAAAARPLLLLLCMARRACAATSAFFCWLSLRAAAASASCCRGLTMPAVRDTDAGRRARVLLLLLVAPLRAPVPLLLPPPVEDAKADAAADDASFAPPLRPRECDRERDRLCRSSSRRGRCCCCWCGLRPRDPERLRLRADDACDSSSEYWSEGEPDRDRGDRDRLWEGLRLRPRPWPRSRLWLRLRERDRDRLRCERPPGGGMELRAWLARTAPLLLPPRSLSITPCMVRADDGNAKSVSSSGGRSVQRERAGRIGRLRSARAQRSR